MTNEQQWTTQGPDQTRAIAGEIARSLPAGSVIALVGDLGAGKTCFVQGVAEALGVTEPVSSPTYTLVQEYSGLAPLVHIDLYRTGGSDEVWQLGLDEYWGGKGLVAIEWPQHVAEFLPACTCWIELSHGTHEEERVISRNLRGTP